MAGFGTFCPFFPRPWDDGARTASFSLLDQDQNLLEILPDHFQKWYKVMISQKGTVAFERSLARDGGGGKGLEPPLLGALIWNKAVAPTRSLPEELCEFDCAGGVDSRNV